tara:strand:- start:1686 stop:2768 length:1083 start_codon:yes stop_codon:yes gene_type:complete
MNICLIGNSLTNFVLAIILINRKIKVDLYQNSKKKIFDDRTIGISEENIKFLKKNNICLNNITWPIKRIEIFNEKNRKNKILHFKNENSNCFSMIKNYDFYKILKKKLIKNTLFREKLIKNNLPINNILNNYDLVINSDQNSWISKKYFTKKIFKDYKSQAYVSTISHKKCTNDTAIQIFTRFGPLAYLPISENKTSVVFSIVDQKKLKENEIISLIKEYNLNYKIYDLSKISKFKLKFSLLRNYFYKNLLAFGDCIHQIHPLAGQGFNMSLRDITILSNIIDEKIELGLEIDSSIPKIFEKKTKSSNLIFSSGIDFIYEFFKFDNMVKNNFSKNIFHSIENKTLLNRHIKSLADKGLVF